METDLNTFDTLGASTNINLTQNPIVDFDRVQELEEPIKAQYIDFEGMGVDLTKNIDEEELRIIYRNLIEFVNDNYTAVTEYDIVTSSPKKILQIGHYIYHFITNEAAFNIMPNYLNTYELFTIDQFESHIRYRLKGDPANFKSSLIKVIKSVVTRLENLQKIKKTVVTDVNYIRLLTKYTYYIELVNYGESDRFLYNYMIPVLHKNFDQILWRTF